MLDLSDADWEAFGVQVKQLAEQQEKQAGKFQVRRLHVGCVYCGGVVNDVCCQISCGLLRR
jgi:hypothetical protein